MLSFKFQSHAITYFLEGAFFTLVCVFLIAADVSAATYYSSPSGSGTTCSSSFPCSLSTGLSKAISGDELVLKNGTYNTYLDTRNDGVVIRAENTHQAVISLGSGSGTLGAQLITIKNKNITMRGLRIDGQKTSGGTVGMVRFYTSSNIIFEDNIIENAAGGLISIGGSVGDAVISNVVFRNNLLQGSGYQIEFGEAVYIGKYDLAASTRQVSNVEFYGNTIKDFGENGFDLKPPTYDIRIHHNLIEGQALKPSGRGNFGIIAMGGNTADVHDNIFRNNVGGDSAVRSNAGGGNKFYLNVVNGTTNTNFAINTESSDNGGTKTAITNNRFCNLSSTRVNVLNGIIISNNAGLDIPIQDCIAREREILVVMQGGSTSSSDTIYFSHDAETLPIAEDTINNNRWSEAQSKVTRNTSVVKNGSYSLRHEMVANVDIQTGKVIKFLTRTPTGGLVEAYYSAWFNIEQGFDDTNPDIWKNIFQFKASNGSPTTVGGDVKWVLSPRIINGTRQLMVSMQDCEVTDSTTTLSAYHTMDYAGTWGGNCKFIKRNSPIPFNKNRWYHLETRYKAADPNRLGNQSIRQPGSFTIWQDGQLVMDIAHPKLNTLTVFNEDTSHPNQWSDNKYMYWGIGMYGSELSQPPLQVLYTDDAKVTSYQVGAGSTIPPALLGDINRDGIVNSLDWSLMSAKWLTNDTSADLNKDGAVNSLDWSVMSSNWLASL